MMSDVRFLVAWFLATALSAFADGESLVDGSKRVVSPHVAVFRGLSMSTPIKTSVDGPLLGNGDMGVCLSEITTKGRTKKVRQTANGPRFWLCKNDFWKLAHDFKTGPSGPRVFGGIDVKFPELQGGSNTEQHFYDAVTVSKWADVEVRSWVAASENMLVVELATTGKDVAVDISLWVQEGDNSDVTKGEENGTMWATRKFARNVEIPTEAACAMKLLGAEARQFTLKAGHPVTVVAAHAKQVQVGSAARACAQTHG